ncbi:MAG: hypothetical protein QM599_12725 [Pseudoxanthomonas sp.]
MKARLAEHPAAMTTGVRARTFCIRSGMCTAFGRKMDDSLTGGSLRKALAQLDELDRFAQESDG